MDDISREPLPDSGEPAALGDALEPGSTKGPAEVMRMAELVVDETQTDRLHTEPMHRESLRIEPVRETLAEDFAGGRFSSQSDLLGPELRGPGLVEAELVSAGRADGDAEPDFDVLGSGEGDLSEGRDEEASAVGPEPEPAEEPMGFIGPLVPDGINSAGPEAESASESAVEFTPDSDPQTPELVEIYGPPIPEGLLDSHRQKVPQMLAAEISDEAVPLCDPGEVSKVAMAVMLSTRESLSSIRLAEICNTSQKIVKVAIAQLEADLREQGLPLEVQQSGDGYKLLTVAAVHPYLRRIKGVKKVERLSPAALETLAVIAYRQPVIRAEVESIRGVKVGPMLRSLLDHKMIKVTGRADVPGRPLQYGTSQQFLERFGLGSLKDLPSIQEFRSLG